MRRGGPRTSPPHCDQPQSPFPLPIRPAASFFVLRDRAFSEPLADSLAQRRVVLNAKFAGLIPACGHATNNQRFDLKNVLSNCDASPPTNLNSTKFRLDHQCVRNCINETGTTVFPIELNGS